MPDADDMIPSVEDIPEVPDPPTPCPGWVSPDDTARVLLESLGLDLSASRDFLGRNPFRDTDIVIRRATSILKE